MPERLHAPEQAEADASPAIAALASGTAPGIALVLALQRATGNRGTIRALARVPNGPKTVDVGAWFERVIWSVVRSWRTGTQMVPSTGELIESLGKSPAEGLLEVARSAEQAAERRKQAEKRDAAEEVADADYALQKLNEVREEYCRLASAAERIAVIHRQLRPDAFQGDWFLSDVQEAMIIDVIRLAPDTQSLELMQALQNDGYGLMRRLDSALDGEANERFWRAISPHMVRNTLATKPPISEAGELQVPTLPWWGANGRATYKVDWNDNGASIHIRAAEREVGLADDVPQQQVRYEGTLKPDDIICVTFEADDPELGAKAGENWFLPAVAFHLFYNKSAKAELIRTLQVAAIVMTAGGVATAVGAAAQLLAAVEFAMAAAAPIVDQYRTDIARTEQGRKFLQYFDFAQKVMLVVGAARLVGAPKLLRRMTDAAFKLQNSGEFTNLQYKNINETLGRIRNALNSAEREAAGGAAAAADAPPSSSRLFTPEVAEDALADAENQLVPTGKGLRARNVFLDVDEPTAVSKGGRWDDPANKRFLERITNSGSKRDLTEFAPAMPATEQISLAQAEANGADAFARASRQMLIRPFSEIAELEQITSEARAAMTNVQRPVGDLRSAINRAIRERIRVGATPQAAVVGRALRAGGIDPQTLSALPEPVQVRVGTGPRVAVPVEPTPPSAAPADELVPNSAPPSQQQQQMRLPTPR